MDSEVSTTATADTDKADEILPISPRTGATSDCSAERQCLDNEKHFVGIENETRLLKNLPLILDNSLISNNAQLNKEYFNNNDNQEQSNNINNNNNEVVNHASQTPTTTTTTSCQSKPIYNEFVNHVYETNSKEPEDEEEDIKPLLKSIVKSPSGNVKPILPLNGTVKTKNKRLSWQASTNPPRYSVNNHVNDTGNTQSTSLDSSDEQATGHNDECPSSPIESSTSSSSSSSSSDDDEFSEVMFQAPDGGYGWLIVFVSFLINMIADGITFSFGVFNVEFLKYFGDSKGKTAWISSIFMATPLLSGPIASYLTDRYGCRKVTIVGAITASIGFLLSAASNSMEMLFVTFGIVAGFGLSLCYVAAVVIVAYYFDKRRSFATGISVCGSGIGTFLFPPLIQYLITHYGWRGCTVLLAGILLNMCVCGALMRVNILNNFEKNS